MIENVVMKALKATTIADKLTTYNQESAIFYQMAPGDMDSSWDKLQYPRINYNIVWAYNPELNISGNLTIDVWCLNNAELAPEDFAEIIQNEMSGLFLTEDGETFCILWSRSDPFEGRGENEPKVIGVTISFNIIAFPKIAFGTPDPIEGMNKWAKDNSPNAMVIGLDLFPETYKATADRPVYYFRLTGNQSRNQLTYAVATIQANITGHIIAPTIKDTQACLKDIVDDLARDGEVMLGETPMIITGLSYSAGLDPLQRGQISIQGDYRIMTIQRDYEKINRIYMGE